MLTAAVILKGVIIGILIHLIFPLIVWIACRMLVKQIKKERIIQPPINELAFIFATYGGLLYVALTILYWTLSGIFYIVVFYLILGGPVVMGYIAYKNWNRRAYSGYHKWTYRLGIFYMIFPISFLLLVALSI